DAVGGRPPMGGFITSAMAKVAAEPAFREAMAASPTQDLELLRLLAAAAVRLYAQVPNFTLLHLVTGTHAARVGLESFPALAAPAFCRALWGDWCAAYATVGAPRFENREAEGPAADWPQIFAAARASDDDHVIKLTWTCHEEEQRWGDPAYRVVPSK